MSREGTFQPRNKWCGERKTPQKRERVLSERKRLGSAESRVEVRDETHFSSTARNPETSRILSVWISHSLFADWSTVRYVLRRWTQRLLTRLPTNACIIDDTFALHGTKNRHDVSFDKSFGPPSSLSLINPLHSHCSLISTACPYNWALFHVLS